MKCLTKEGEGSEYHALRKTFDLGLFRLVAIGDPVDEDEHYPGVQNVDFVAVMANDLGFEAHPVTRYGGCSEVNREPMFGVERGGKVEPLESHIELC